MLAKHYLHGPSLRIAGDLFSSLASLIWARSSQPSARTCNFTQSSVIVGEPSFAITILGALSAGHANRCIAIGLGVLPALGSCCWDFVIETRVLLAEVCYCVGEDAGISKRPRCDLA